jgi:2,4-dienoyl-CoA reductase-like NADH-dependent reductase (Old Yellow Enzyme family)
MGRLAMGGAGTVFVEETAVEPNGRKTHQCAGLWSAAQVPAYRRVVDTIRSFGAVPAIQIGHSGRKGSCHGALRGWAPLTEADAADGFAPWIALAPSALPDSPERPAPHAMDKGDIADVIAAFAGSARLAAEAGFELIEIHGAHGYLIHQFLSPLANLRTDGYGGSRTNRMSFALEVAEAVRAAWPQHLPLWWRASCVDGKGGAWDLGDTVALARELKARDVDMIDCSSGGIYGTGTMPAVPRTPGYQVGFAATIRREAGIGTVAVGEITGPAQAEAILADGKADLVAMARELMLDANWPARAARELGIDDWPGVLPAGYAQRLRQREAVRRLYAAKPEATMTEADRAAIEAT